MICHEDNAGELLLKLPNTLRRDDSTGAPIIRFHINSQVCEMVLNAQSEHGDTSSGTDEEANARSRFKTKTMFRQLGRYELLNLQQSESSPLSSQICSVVLPSESWTHT
jgi:hypothetical protein